MIGPGERRADWEALYELRGRLYAAARRYARADHDVVRECEAELELAAVNLVSRLLDLKAGSR